MDTVDIRVMPCYSIIRFDRGMYRSGTAREIVENEMVPFPAISAFYSLGRGRAIAGTHSRLSLGLSISSKSEKCGVQMHLAGCITVYT